MKSPAFVAAPRSQHRFKTNNEETQRSFCRKNQVWLRIALIWEVHKREKCSLRAFSQKMLVEAKGRIKESVDIILDLCHALLLALSGGLGIA